MRKTLVSLSIALAFTSGAAFADQATVTALQEAGIVMTAEQTEAVLNAEGEEIAAAVGMVVAANPEQAAAIVSAAVTANPTLAAAITKAATKAAPGQRQAIKNAAIAAAPSQAAAIRSASAQGVAAAAAANSVSMPSTSTANSSIADPASLN